MQRLDVNSQREPFHPTNSSLRNDSKIKSISDSIVPRTDGRFKTSQNNKTESRSKKEFESRSARIITRRATAAHLELRYPKPEEVASNIKVTEEVETVVRRSPRTTMLRRQSVLITGSDSYKNTSICASGNAKKRKPNFDEMLLGINQYYKPTTNNNNNNNLAINANSNSSSRSSTSSSSSSYSSDLSASAHSNKGRPNITYSKDKVKRLIIPKSKIFEGAFRTDTSLVMPCSYVRLERNQFIDRLGKLCALTANQSQPYR